MFDSHWVLFLKRMMWHGIHCWWSSWMPEDSTRPATDYSDALPHSTFVGNFHWRPDGQASARMHEDRSLATHCLAALMACHRLGVLLVRRSVRDPIEDVFAMRAFYCRLGSIECRMICHDDDTDHEHTWNIFKRKNVVIIFYQYIYLKKRKFREEFSDVFCYKVKIFRITNMLILKKKKIYETSCTFKR